MDAIVQDSRDRITKLEANQQGVVEVLKELKEKIESLQVSSSKMNQITALLEQLNTRVSDEINGVSNELKVHVQTTSLLIETIRKEQAQDKLSYATDKATLLGTISGVKTTWSIITLLCSLVLGTWLWVIQQKTIEYDMAKAISLGNGMEIQQLQGQVKTLTQLLENAIKKEKEEHSVRP